MIYTLFEVIETLICNTGLWNTKHGLLSKFSLLNACSVQPKSPHLLAVENQHVQLVQDRQDLLQTQAVLHPTPQGTDRDLRHIVGIQPQLIQELQKPLEVGGGAPQFLQVISIFVLCSSD